MIAGTVQTLRVSGNDGSLEDPDNQAFPAPDEVAGRVPRRFDPQCLGRSCPPERPCSGTHGWGLGSGTSVGSAVRQSWSGCRTRKTQAVP